MPCVDSAHSDGRIHFDCEQQWSHGKVRECLRRDWTQLRIAAADSATSASWLEALCSFQWFTQRLESRRRNEFHSSARVCVRALKQKHFRSNEICLANVFWICAKFDNCFCCAVLFSYFFVASFFSSYIFIHSINRAVARLCVCVCVIHSNSNHFRLGLRYDLFYNRVHSKRNDSLKCLRSLAALLSAYISVK